MNEHTYYKSYNLEYIKSKVDGILNSLLGSVYVDPDADDAAYALAAIHAAREQSRRRVIGLLEELAKYEYIAKSLSIIEKVIDHDAIDPEQKVNMIRHITQLVRGDMQEQPPSSPRPDIPPTPPIPPVPPIPPGVEDYAHRPVERKDKLPFSFPKDENDL